LCPLQGCGGSGGNDDGGKALLAWRRSVNISERGPDATRGDRITVAC